MSPDVALPAGVYRHYKGPLYLVLGLAHDANAEELSYHHPLMKDDQGGRGMWEVLVEREVVVYVGLQLDAAHEGARLAVRTLQDFFAKVCGYQHCEGFGKQVRSSAESCWQHEVARFSYVGPRFDAGMLP